MNLLVFDIESDDLLLGATRVHCLVTVDPNSGETRRFRPSEMVAGYKHLLTADRIIAHNGVLFDVPVLENLVGKPNNLPPLPKCFDTLLMSRLLWPDSKDKASHPAGGHSLKAWGQFLSNHKGDSPESWEVFTEDMLEYCEQDVKVTVDVYRYILPLLTGKTEAVRIEHKTAEIITKQILNGFPVDMRKVEALHRTLSTRLAELQDEFSHIPPWQWYEEGKKPAYWYIPDTWETARTKGELPKKLQRFAEKGPPRWVLREELFNANSGSHKARLFVEKYNWKPVQLGAPDKNFPEGVPCTDVAVMKSLKYPEARTFTLISRTKKILSTYAQAWLESECNGRVHGSVITNGAVTGRMTHNTPNFNVPKIKKNKDGSIKYAEAGGWGYECRDCFTCRKGWVLVGADASGLELRMLAHYLHAWDGGKYADIVLHGDVHEANRLAAGLPTRDNAKTFDILGVYKLL